jgi:hypothetical protein
MCVRECLCVECVRMDVCLHVFDFEVGQRKLVFDLRSDNARSFLT